MDELLSKIHGHAYWRVLIRPAEFDPKRIPTLGQCEAIVRSAQIALRGWDYPWIERVDVGKDWIQCGYDSDKGPRYEFWRLFQSGQFVHHFTCFEDFFPLARIPAPPRYLLVLNTLYTTTEIFEFAARLAAQGVLQARAKIGIRLHGMQDRELTNQNLLEWPILRGRVSKMDVIEHETLEPASTVLAEAPRLAREAASAIFERFGWLDPPQGGLEEAQRKFLERRLGV